MSDKSKTAAWGGALGALAWGLVGCGGGTDSPAVAGEEVQSAAQATTTCVTIARGAQGDIADATIRADRVNTAGGNTSTINVGIVPNGGGERRGLMSFDLSPIPGGQQILSATLTIQQGNNTGFANINGYHVTQPWGENSVTWASSPSFVPQQDFSVSNNGFGFSGPITIDLTSLTSSWYAGSLANYGILLKQNIVQSSSLTTYKASESPVPGARPQLVVCFQPAATCNDGIQNQGETGIDCGGPCGPCATCNDGIQNQGETGVDCGGPCQACQSGVCGNGLIENGERCDGANGVPGGIACFPPNSANQCNFDFSAAPQFYCNGGCSWSGGGNCDQGDADIFCRLLTANPNSTASSYQTTTALPTGGFPCAPQGYGPYLGTFPEYGVNINVSYQSSSILANHGPGTVIVNPVCTHPASCNDGIQNQGEAGVDCGGPCPVACGGGNGSGFSTSDVQQVGPQLAQYTKCGSVTNGGLTCIDPLIRYGNVPDGVPAQHGNNDFNLWCQQLGFQGYQANSVQYGNRSYTSPFGKLFWCSGYDEATAHWCDWQDGTWYNQQLDAHYAPDGQAITSITCFGAPAATCSDGIQNQGEAGIDCGGPCPNACGGGTGFSTSDVQQSGLQLAQYTKCASVTNNGHTCIDPLIRYGNVPDGVPAQHSNNDFNAWCQQLGFASYQANSVQYGNRSYTAPFGKLFWSGFYDEAAPHWADWQDGTWYNQSLDYHPAPDGQAITSITCN